MGKHICHIEIPCKDVARAKAFYGKIFGWTFQDFGESYAVFNTGNGVGGGLDLRTDDFPTERGITLYIEIEDIPQYLTKVNEEGCRIIKEKTEISKEFGYYALFADTEGNVMGLWSKS